MSDPATKKTNISKCDKSLLDHATNEIFGSFDREFCWGEHFLYGGCTRCWNQGQHMNVRYKGNCKIIAKKIFSKKIKNLITG